MRLRPLSHRIREVIYGLRLCRTTHLDLKWLGKSPGELLAEHHADGSITLEPMTPMRYVVRPTEDGQVVLNRPLNAKASYVQVHHKDDGRISIVPWQLIEDEYPRGLEQTGIVLSVFDGEHVVLRYENDTCEALQMAFIPDDWDRTVFGLNDRPREIREREHRARLGEAAWQKLQERRQRAREHQAAKRRQAAGGCAVVNKPTEESVHEQERPIQDRSSDDWGRNLNS